MPSETIKNEFYKRLFKEIRKKKGLTQKALGEIIGKKEITIRKYEGGQLKISDELIYLVVKKLNILQNQFLNIITSLEVISGLMSDEYDKDSDYITHEFLTNMLESFYYDVSTLDLSYVPVCPKSKNECMNENYTKKLTQKCKDDIYFFISQIIRLNDKENKIKDVEIAGMSDTAVNYIIFLLKQNKIID